MPADRPTRPAVPALSSRGYVLAVLVLIASLGLVALYARSAGEREQDLAQTRLAGDAERVAARLRQRLLTYELVSRGGVSLFATVQRPTAQQWRHYTEGLDLAERFPAMLGLCYAESLSPAQLQDLQLERRAAGDGLFQIRPLGIRPRYGPVVYLEPRTASNAATIGFDMLSEPARAAAMAAAGNDAAARMTAPILLDQEVDATGLVIYTPVYRAGIVPANVRAREPMLAGWVCAPIRVKGFVDTVMDDLRRDLSLRIVDLGGDGVERTVYPEPGVAFPGDGEDGASHSIEEKVYGRRWRLDFHVPATRGGAMRLEGAQGTIAVGLLASLLLFAVALSLARTQSQAQRIAERMSESYRRSELRFRNAMRFSAIGKALLGGNGRIVDVNLALANILHSSPEELVGRDLMSFFVDRPGGAEEPVRAAGSVYRVTRDLLREDGELRHVHLTFAQVPGEIGQDVESLVQVEDITARLRAEARVRALNRTLEARVALRTRELTRANEELESFAYSVSHDLRAPLRAIDGFSRLLTERYSDSIDEVGRDYLSRVRVATARMSELIDALLKMSRLSRGELRREPLDLAAIARDIVAELRQQEPQREVAVEIDPAMPASGDAALVRNLLDNLLGNAWKFTRATGDARIHFTRELRDGEPWYVVRDNGAGFEQAYAGKLFRPFQRLHTQDEFPGHGIGLASVRRIVERHGGSIVAEGRPGDGATFRFTLPEPEPEGAAMDDGEGAV